MEMSLYITVTILQKWFDLLMEFKSYSATATENTFF
jgi:hypothetical protein